MSTDPNLLILILGIAFLTPLVGFLKYAVSVWAIRTAKSPAEMKAQTEVAGRAVSSSPLKLPGPKKSGEPD